MNKRRHALLLVTGFMMIGVIPGWALGRQLPIDATVYGTGELSPSATIHVDCAAAARGDGSAQRPYWRITDALERARQLRRSDPRRIVIHVATGICSGNFETQPTRRKTRPPELLPLVLNVPNLTLHGAGIMRYAEGYPVAQRAGTATTLTVDVPRLDSTDNTVIYVGPTTDGGRADGTVIEGLAIDDAFNSLEGIWVSRTRDITIRGNVVEHLNVSGISTSDSSGSIVGNVFSGTLVGAGVGAGSQASPAKLYVGGNSIVANDDGVILIGNSMATVSFDMGANPLEILPYPTTPAADQMGTRMDVELAGNDVSNNFDGLHLQILGNFRYPYSRTGKINVRIHDNRFMDNSGHPFAIEQGFVFRSTSTYWTAPDLTNWPAGFFGYFAAPFITHGPIDGPYSGVVNASFEHNRWSNAHVTPIAPAMLTYSNIDVYDPATGAPDPSLVGVFTYMRNSHLNLHDEDGLFSLPGVIRDDLRPLDPLDGTALQNQTRITH
jgi:hypothetical protein